MDPVLKIQLRDENIPPDDDILRSTLENAYEPYCQLLGIFNAYGLTYEWRYYKDGKAWLCKVQKKSKTIVWMSAWSGMIKASIYFHDKYLDKFYALEIRESVKEQIASAKNTGKIKPCTFEITNMELLIDFEKVMKLKTDL